MGLGEALSERVRRGALRFIPPPQSALRLRDIVTDPGHSLQQAVAAVMLDPMLAGVVLRLANSTEFVRQGPTTSLSMAVQRLGDTALAKLAFASLLTSDAGTPGPLKQVRQGLLQRALIAAHTCERLAPTFDLDAHTAFVAGLLHDVGTLVSMNTLELVIAQVGAEQRDEASWLKLARPHHRAVAAILCTRWSLPSALSDAIMQSSDPGQRSALGQLLWLVEELVDGLEAGLSLEELTRSPRLTILSPQDRTDAIAKLSVLPSLVAAFGDEGQVSLGACVSLVSASTPQAEGRWFDGELSRGQRVRLLLDGDGRPRLLEGERLHAGLEAVTLQTSEGSLRVWVRVLAPQAVEGALRASAVPFALDSVLMERLRVAVDHAGEKVS